MRSIEKAPSVKTLSKGNWGTIEAQRDVRGQCQGKEQDVENWYIDRVNMKPERLDEKRALCKDCPRKWLCLVEAVSDVEEDRAEEKGYGYMRAGTTPTERLAARVVVESMIAQEHPVAGIARGEVDGAIFLRLLQVANHQEQPQSA